MSTKKPVLIDKESYGTIVAALTLVAWKCQKTDEAVNARKVFFDLGRQVGISEDDLKEQFRSCMLMWATP